MATRPSKAGGCADHNGPCNSFQKRVDPRLDVVIGQCRHPGTAVTVNFHCQWVAVCRCGSLSAACIAGTRAPDILAKKGGVPDPASITTLVRQRACVIRFYESQDAILLLH